MKYKLIILLYPLLFLAQEKIHAQVIFNKIDSTLKIGKAGYRVDCRNRSIDQNQLTIRPVGFDAEVHEMSFPIKGRVSKAMVDDLNSDGWPDLILFIYTDSNARLGTVYGIISDGSKSVLPCMLPDVSLDGKVNTGYKGYDEFSMLEGTLLQKFPVYKKEDEKGKPTGGHRVIMYQLARNGTGGYKFNMLRFYDTQ